jgi:hypothetical protein
MDNLCDDSHLFPCKNAVYSATTGRWNNERLEHRALDEESLGVLNVTRSYNEAHFHFDCYIDKQSDRFTASEYPRLSVVNLLHLDSYTLASTAFAINHVPGNPLKILRDIHLIT